MSGDGRSVAFVSEASNLVRDDTDEEIDVFVRDLDRGDTERVSVASDGSQLERPRGPGRPSISAEGRFVAFTFETPSFTPEHITADEASNRDLFIRDREEQTSFRLGGPPGSYFYSVGSASMSDNGSEVVYVAFGDSAAMWHYDRETGEQRRIFTGPDETSIYDIGPAEISGDGSSTIFQASDSLARTDTNTVPDIYALDVRTQAIEQVSVTSSERSVFGDSVDSALSDSGRYVAFESYSSPFVREDRDDDSDIYIRDRTRGETYGASIGVHADGKYGFRGVALSGSGEVVAFDSGFERRSQIYAVEMGPPGSHRLP